MLPQEGHLFSGTIADNVRLAQPEASDEEVVRALDEIGALDPLRGAPGRDRHRRPDPRRPALGR